MWFTYLLYICAWIQYTHVINWIMWSRKLPAPRLSLIERIIAVLTGAFVLAFVFLGMQEETFFVRSFLSLGVLLNISIYLLCPLFLRASPAHR